MLTKKQVPTAAKTRAARPAKVQRSRRGVTDASIMRKYARIFKLLAAYDRGEYELPKR